MAERGNSSSSVYIISGDSYLTAIQDYLGIKIVSPKEFLGLAGTELS